MCLTIAFNYRSLYDMKINVILTWIKSLHESDWSTAENQQLKSGEQKKTSIDWLNKTTTTVLRPLYRSTCVSRHLKLLGIHTQTRLTALCPGLPGWASTKKVKPIWILLKQETVSGSGMRWAICKFAPRSRQITTPAPHHSVFYRLDALPAAQPTVSKHWRAEALKG